jgi:hypothetical protein
VQGGDNMQCLGPDEANDMLKGTQFYIDTSFAVAPPLRIREVAQPQERFGGVMQNQSSRHAELAQALNRWIPHDGERLIWVGDANESYLSLVPVLETIRAGLCERRKLRTAPGHWFSAYDYHEFDQTKISEDQAFEESLLVACLSLVLSGYWDAWLVSPREDDYIEFHEDCVYFYTRNENKIREARSILRGC